MTTALEGMRGQRQAPAALYTRERPGTHCTGGWVCPGPVWTGAENLAPPLGIPSPERPARSQSLYRLSYRAHKVCPIPAINVANPEIKSKITFNQQLKEGLKRINKQTPVSQRRERMI